MPTKPSLSLVILMLVGLPLGQVAYSQQTESAATLSDQLAARAAASAAKKKNRKQKAKFREGIEIVRQTGIEESAKQVGDAAPDATLSGWDGSTVTLSKLWSERPIVLMWYRGGWCPYCNIQLRAMQQSMDQLDSAGARLVVLTPELPERAEQTAKANDLDLVALHDKDNQVAKKYGVLFDLPELVIPFYRDKLKLSKHNGNDKLELPLAATYVIDTSGKITYAYLESDYAKRAEPSEILAAIKATQ